MRSIALISAITVIAFVQPTEARAEASAQLRSFKDWCSQKELAPKESKNTIEAVLAVVGTRDCRVADSRVNVLKDLQLNNKQIKDLWPIASLVNLERLNLDNNEIVDLSPLKNLLNLKQLRIQGNEIKDINSLSSLTSIRKLGLQKNQITDVSALANINNLEQLTLEGNQINDFTPLKKLDKLHSLKFDKNSVRQQAVRGFEDLMLRIDLNNGLDNTSLEEPCKTSCFPGTLPESLVKKITELQGMYSPPTVGSLTGGFVGALTGFIWLLKSNFMIKRGKRKNSEFLGQALDIFPGFEKDWLELAKALAKVGYYEKAVEVLDKLVTIEPDNAEIWRARGNALANIPKVDDALKSYQTAIMIESIQAKETQTEPIDEIRQPEADIKWPF